MVNNYEIIKEMKEYADQNNIPIMLEEGINYLVNYILLHNSKNILEIGTAIGYSAICMASVDPSIHVTSIERDEKRYLEAVKNIKKANLEAQITLIYKDALEVSFDEEFDLIFIDAAKAQNIKFFERFEKKLSKEGAIITDNLDFHGLVKNPKEIKSKNVKALVRKLKDYIEYLKKNPAYKTEFLNIGDGLAISTKKDNKDK